MRLAAICLGLHWTLRRAAATTLIVYAAPPSPRNRLYLDNFDFFLRHGLPSSNAPYR